MRASNLQDLVYKNGQGGITKATVSITFDNSNKSQSPLGFETHDEITVTRQVGKDLDKEGSDIGVQGYRMQCQHIF